MLCSFVFNCYLLSELLTSIVWRRNLVSAQPRELCVVEEKTWRRNGAWWDFLETGPWKAVALPLSPVCASGREEILKVLSLCTGIQGTGWGGLGNLAAGGLKGHQDKFTLGSLYCREEALFQENYYKFLLNVTALCSH